MTIVAFDIVGLSVLVWWWGGGPAQREGVFARHGLCLPHHRRFLHLAGSGVC
jgi:hypothetical protein